MRARFLARIPGIRAEPADNSRGVYLKQLDIHGFKTFAEKTQIVFTPGVTCVIGPNGSGKSNIADAVLWVLGENNVRSLRGSASQDVIFAGNDRRRSLGMAEVSLTIDNTGRVLPLDFGEITVTRRLYRSGESECFINKVACRLRDIYELFLDTGVGRDAYSMVNQGQIDQILSVRSEDRRAIFEEAAGIKKYRVRKREAERKLDHTQQNLLRANDIISEIEGQLGPLQRQASAARRYRDLAGRLRSLETAWYGTRLKRLNSERGGLAALVTDLNAERARLDSELEASRESETMLRESIQALDARAEELRAAETAALQRLASSQAERARSEERSGEVQRRLLSLEKELDDLSARMEEQVARAGRTQQDEGELKREVAAIRVQLGAAQVAAQERSREHEAAVRDLEGERLAWLARERHRAGLEARVQSLEARNATLVQTQQNAAGSVTEAEAEVKRLSVQRDGFLTSAQARQEEAAALEGELDALRAGLREVEQALARARAEADSATRTLDAQRARHQALSELGDRAEGAAAGARALLEASRRGEVPGAWSLMVEGIRAQSGLESAVAAALGVYGDALLCHDEGSALAGLRWLRAQNAGAVALPGLPTDERAIISGSLAESIQGDGAALAWARHLLRRVILADSLETALAARRDADSPDTPDSRTPAHPNTRTPEDATLWVTPAGEWVAASGAAGGGVRGSDGSAAALLARRRDIDLLELEAPALQTAAAAALEVVEAAEARVRQAQTGVREAQSRLDGARAEHQAQLREADRRKSDVERARQRLERMRQELMRMEREAAGAAELLARSRAELNADDSPRGEPPSSTLAGAEETLRTLETARRESEAAVTELRVRLAQEDQRLQGVAAAAQRAAEASVFLDRQRSERLREQHQLNAEREQREIAFGSLAEALEDAEAAARAAREGGAERTKERARRTTEFDQARAAAQQLEARLRELMERCHRAEVELTAVDTERGHLGRQWLDSTVSAHSIEVTQAEDFDEPLSFTVEGLMEAWDPVEADAVLNSYSDPEAELGRQRRQIRALGAVNPDAVEQHAAAQERYDFLTSQRSDLESAREQLEAAIRDIDAASKDTFLAAFREIAEAFDEMFVRLFGGGTTELRLTDPDDVLETGIDVIVQPPGKKQQNLLLLSGGERALTAAAMLFALLKVRPSPFCVLDEVDAPLDENNVGRFCETLRDFSARTQFIVVTHNRRTMEDADTLYGVTMEERGVSKVLSCALTDPVVAKVEAESRAVAVA